MCESLRQDVLSVRDSDVFVVKDVSLLDYYHDAALQPPPALQALRERYDTLLMYVGNLERYQGVRLMLQAFARVQQPAAAPRNGLVIIGGDADRIAHYQALARELGVAERCHFLGPQPVGLLATLLRQADILMSPRIQGTNTPLKLYSYLDSGVPVLATRLTTHTQIVNGDQALLCDTTPEAMAAGIEALASSPALRRHLAGNARCLIATHHSMEGFRQQLLDIYQVLTQPKPAVQGNAKPQIS